MIRRLLTVFAAGALLAISTATAAAQGDAPRKLAFLVGVKQYIHPELTALRYTENDVTEMAALLKKAGYDVTVLCDSTGKKDAALAPTKANIDRQLAKVLAKCKGREDTIVVAFAGHGLQFEGHKDAFFCPKDGKPFEQQIKTLVSLGDVYTQLEQSYAGIRVMLVDACRNDPKLGRGVDSDNSPRPPQGVAVLFSCAKGEVAYEHEKYQHGVFFYHVLEGLRGRARNTQGKVTFASLADYVCAAVAEDVPNVIGQGAQQSPNLKADLAGASPVLLAVTGAPRLAAVQASLSMELAALTRADAKRWGVAAGQPQVALVLPGGGGEQLGLRAGDVLVRVNTQSVSSIKQYQAAVKDVALGTRVDVAILRNGKPQTVSGPYQSELSPAEEMQRLRQLGNNPIAQCAIADMYATGRGVGKSNQAEALLWYRKAADQGNARAQANVGRLLQIAGKDDVEAVAYLRKAAEQDQPLGQYNLAVMFEQGRGGLTKDPAEAMQWCRKSADQGLAQAQFHLANMYLKGKAPSKDDAEGVRWMRKAAEQDYPIALNAMGNFYKDGSRGVAKDDVEATKWYKKAAERGNMMANHHLGVLYESSKSLKDYAEAAKWYKRAAELNHGQSQHNLAQMYEAGKGIARDDAEAAKWYRRAAERDIAPAQGRLGTLYADGRGVPQDFAEALKWCQKSAASKDAVGQNGIGELYEDGKAGLPKSYPEAVKWFKAAADQGYPRAQYNLGRMYEGGVGGLPQNVPEAVRLYRLAAAQGIAGAQKCLKRLSAKK
jgi:TPR repeat protein/uncharacterized caspase-like protein